MCVWVKWVNTQKENGMCFFFTYFWLVFFSRFIVHLALNHLFNSYNLCVLTRFRHADRRTRILLFSTTFLLSTGLLAQNNTLDSLERVCAGQTDYTERLNTIALMADIAFENDLNQALVYTQRGVALADSVGATERQPVFYEMHGRMYANMLKLDSASKYFDKAMVGYQTNNDLNGQATTAFKKAWVSKRKGNVEKAIEYDLFALRMMEESGNQAGVARAFGQVSEDLLMQGREKEALEYAQKSIDASLRNDLTEELYYAYRNAGDAQLAMGANYAALELYNKSIKIAKDLEFGLMSMADITNCKGNALKRIGRYEEALTAYEECLDFAEKSNYRNAVSASIANMGEVNLLMGNFSKALTLQLKTIEMQESWGDVSNLVENYNHAATIYAKTGDYQSAWIYEKKARALHDSLLSEKSDLVISQLRTQYETEKNEATIAAQQAKLLARNKVQWLTIGVVALLVVFLGFLFRSYRIRIVKNAQLRAKNAENELLMKEIHHRVKNNLEIVSSLLELQSAGIKDKGVKDAIQEGQNRVQSIGIVHQKLYMGTHVGAIEMKDYFENLSESILDSFGVRERITINCAMEKLDLDIDTAVPLGLIVNELLTNSMKYAFPGGRNGTVHIKLEKDRSGNLQLVVADDGVGKGTATQGTGFGKQLIDLLTRQLEGSVREETINGTQLFFQFNLNRQYG